MIKSAQLIKDFISEKLNGDVHALKDFDFMKLEGDKKYGCCGRHFDCDDTDLARAIYYTVWKDDLPEFGLEDIGPGKKYRGDTLNTAKTLFGFEPQKNNPYWRAAKFSDDKDFFKDISQFRDKYLTIGNFMLLPNYPLPGHRTTLNTYRSWGKWYDFFDKFLFELNKCFIDDRDKDEGLALLINANKFYFDPFDNDIQKLSKVNFLELYFKDRREVNVLNFLCDFPRRCDYIKNPTQEQRKEYVRNSKNYISFATKVINDRANKIINRLKNNLDE